MGGVASVAEMGVPSAWKAKEHKKDVNSKIIVYVS